jgi:hypothetical protein
MDNSGLVWNTLKLTPLKYVHGAGTRDGLAENMGIKPLVANRKLAFTGVLKRGNFEVDGETARKWLGDPNRSAAYKDVVRPWVSGQDIVARPSGKFIIDFSSQTEENEISMKYPDPYSYLKEKAFQNHDQTHLRSQQRWWCYEQPRFALQAAIKKLDFYIVTPQVSKHRLFRFMHSTVLPDSTVTPIVNSDPLVLGILNSQIHTVWSERIAGQLRYRWRIP